MGAANDFICLEELTVSIPIHLNENVQTGSMRLGWIPKDACSKTFHVIFYSSAGRVIIVN